MVPTVKSNGFVDLNYTEKPDPKVALNRVASKIDQPEIRNLTMRLGYVTDKFLDDYFAARSVEEMKAFLDIVHPSESHALTIAPPVSEPEERCHNARTCFRACSSQTAKKSKEVFNLACTKNNCASFWKEFFVQCCFKCCIGE